MSQDKKRETIIEAALKRFAHFGVSKTTMTEIGNDLGISKASLYYYFPDKINLFAAVIKAISEEQEKSDDLALSEEKDPYRAMEMYLDRRTAFIIKYYNVLEFIKNTTNIPAELQPFFEHVKKRELRVVQQILEKGQTLKMLKIEDLKRTSELFFDTLQGFRHHVLSQHNNFFPDKKQFLSVLKREKELSTIFFRGLAG